MYTSYIYKLKISQSPTTVFSSPLIQVNKIFSPKYTRLEFKIFLQVFVNISHVFIYGMNYTFRQNCKNIHINYCFTITIQDLDNFFLIKYFLKNCTSTQNSPSLAAMFDGGVGKSALFTWWRKRQGRGIMSLNQGFCLLPWEDVTSKMSI